MAELPSTQSAAQPAQVVTQSRNSLAQFMFLIGMGLFITTIGQPKVIGRLPFTLLFKNQLHLKPSAIAGFWAVATLAWYCKPIAGLLCDSIPLFGTRRRYYLILSSLFSGVLWIFFGLVPRTYQAFFWVMLLLNALMVIASTVVGGLLVEEGQRQSATGRLSSMRNALEGVMAFITGPLGGYLAAQAFGWTVGVGAALLFSLVPVAYFLLPEAPVARRNMAVWTSAGVQLASIVRSYSMWAGTAMLFLYFFAPGFQTPLVFYQTDHLKLKPEFLGWLELVGGAGGLVGAAIYAAVCRKFNLRPMIVAGIFINVLGTLLYLKYDSARLALLIEFSNGLFGVLGALPLYDLAARATPRGSESFGFALMMSVRNAAIFAISDPLGSWIYDHWHIGFKGLVWLNAGTSLLALIVVPFLPRIMVNRREGEPAIPDIADAEASRKNTPMPE